MKQRTNKQINSDFKFDKELEKLVTKKKGQKKSDYLKTSFKLELGTHPPAQILTIYFLTNKWLQYEVSVIIWSSTHKRAFQK